VLPWSKERDDAEKLTLGGTAKYTLAVNAARDAALLRELKVMREVQPADAKAVLTDVIAAADDVDLARIRKETLASVDEIRRKGAGSKRDLSFWGQAGETVVAGGCLTAAVLGQVEFGIPCVVGGSLSSAALHFWQGPN
jgi:hypothetical protein